MDWLEFAALRWVPRSIAADYLEERGFLQASEMLRGREAIGQLGNIVFPWQLESFCHHVAVALDICLHVEPATETEPTWEMWFTEKDGSHI